MVQPAGEKGKKRRYLIAYIASMKIAMLMDTSYPPDARVTNEIRTLQAAGHTVDLFSIRYHTRDRGPGWFSSYLERDRYEGTSIWRWHAGRFWFKASALVYSIPVWKRWVASRIRAFIEESGPDVVHIHDMVIAGAGLAEAERVGLPVVLDLHEDRPTILPHYPHMERPWTRWLVQPARWPSIQQTLMHKAERVILVTEEARAVASERDHLPLERSLALPNVVWPGEFSVDSGSVGLREDRLDSSVSESLVRPIKLLYIGDTSERRGVGSLLRAVKRVADEGRQVELIVVGDSSRHQEQVRLARELGVAPHVEWTGWLAPRDLPAQVARADIGVSPLLRNPHHDTTYANKLFQYMAGGLAVIVSDCPAQSALVRRESCGVVYTAGDPALLADRIRWMIDHPDERREMGRRSREAVLQRWNWDVTGRTLINLYESLQSHTNGA